MYSRAIPVLGCSCLVAVALYLLAVAATVFFATWQTGLARSIQEMEGSVISLETEYYEAVERFSSIDPVARGFTSPRSVEYVSSTGVSSLSRADQ